MCRLNHPLAAIRSMSWPHFGLHLNRWAGTECRILGLSNHLMAETAGFGSIRWPETSGELAIFGIAIIPIRRRRGLLRRNCFKRGATEENFPLVAIFVPVTVRNHPMATRIRTHDLAKTAIGWVE